MKRKKLATTITVPIYDAATVAALDRARRIAGDVGRAAIVRRCLELALPILAAARKGYYNGR